MTKIRYTLSAFTMALLLSCGGSSNHPGPEPSPTPTPISARSIHYQDPAGSGWRLMRNAVDSTPGFLTLDLIGPSGTRARGIGLTLGVDSDSLSYEKYPDGSYIKDHGVFELANAAGAEADSKSPKLLVAGVKGERLMIGIFQKNAAFTSKDCAQSLVQFKLKVKPGAMTFWPVRLEVLKAQILPDDITRPEAQMQPIVVAVGTVSCQ